MRLVGIVICLILLGLTGYSAITHKAPKIEADIEKRTGEAIAALAGDDVEVLVDGRHVTLQGRVTGDEQKQTLLDAAASVHGSLGPIDGLEGIAVASPYRFEAVRGDDGMVMIEGVAPSAEVRDAMLADIEAIFGEEADVAIELAAGAPAGDWRAAAGAGLDALVTMREGRLSITDETVLLSGRVQNDGDVAAIDAFAQTMPEGFDWTHDVDVERAAAEPYMFSMVKNLDGSLYMSGHAPDEAMRDRLVEQGEAIADGKSVTADIELADGMPNQEWPALVEAGIVAMQDMEAGRFDVIDNDVSFTVDPAVAAVDDAATETDAEQSAALAEPEPEAAPEPELEAAPAVEVASEGEAVTDADAAPALEAAAEAETTTETEAASELEADAEAAAEAEAAAATEAVAESEAVSAEGETALAATEPAPTPTPRPTSASPPEPAARPALEATADAAAEGDAEAVEAEIAAAETIVETAPDGGAADDTTAAGDANTEGEGETVADDGAAEGDGVDLATTAASETAAETVPDGDAVDAALTPAPEDVAEAADATALTTPALVIDKVQEGPWSVRGVVPDGEAEETLLALIREQAGSDELDVELALAEVEDDGLWLSYATDHIKSLDEVVAGQLSVDDFSSRLVGVVETQDDVDEVQTALAAIDPSMNVDLQPIDPRPMASLSLTLSTDDGVVLDGTLPGGLSEEEALNALGIERYEGELGLDGRGEAQRWRRNLSDVGDLLPVFEQVSLSLGGERPRIAGQVYAGSDADGIARDLVIALSDDRQPEVDIEVSTVRHKEASRRTNPLTGVEEVRENGYWLPVIEIAADQATCGERSATLLDEGRITFLRGEATLDNQAEIFLNTLASLVRACVDEAELALEIGGHTDARGAAKMNEELSQARADAVLVALVARGVEGEAMVAVGYGPSRPIADNATEAGRAQNRRISFEWKTSDDLANAGGEG